MKPLLILKVGSTFSEMAAEIGDFEDWIRDGLGPQPWPVEVLNAQQGAALPPASSLRGLVITGSHAMVSDREPWSEALVPWLRDLVVAEVPLLGICYGHQLLAHALGGKVGNHPGGREIGTVSIAKTPAASTDPLFGALPLAFPAHAVHRQTVLRLPDGAIALASNRFEPRHAFRIGTCAWGVQFHPEFSEQAMNGYLSGMRETLLSEGVDADTLLTRTVATPASASLLERFASLLNEPARADVAGALIQADACQAQHNCD